MSETARTDTNGSERPMIAADRQRRIVSLVESRGSARVVTLAQELSVTGETIRRDLEKLESEGKLIRRHGGAVAVDNHRERTFGEREVQLVTEKQAIARVARSYLEEGDRIFLDASTTALTLCRILPEIQLTVVTNALRILVELSTRPNIHVVCVGGTLSHNSYSFVGPFAEQDMRHYHVDKLFLSASGADVQRGVGDANEWHATLKKTMIEMSEQRYLLVDHSKLGVRSLVTFARFRDFDETITDTEADPAILRAIQATGHKVTVA